MLPGKQYQPEDILTIGLKRIWFLLLPWAIVSAGVAVYARWLPDMYRAETTIRVIPPRVSENIVRPTMTTRLDDRLQSIAQQILSRTRLEKIIQDHGLYLKERQDGELMEDIVEQMRFEDIRVNPLKGDAFQVTYQGVDRRAVKEVTERLATLFIDANMRERSNLADVASQFIDSSLDEKKRQLQETEAKLEDYKRRYAGQLPQQVSANLQVLESAEMQIRNIAESVNRDRDRRLLLERQIAEVEQLVIDGVPGGSGGESQLAAARAELAAQEARRRKAGHPDYDRALAKVRQLESTAPEQDPEVNASSPDYRRLAERQRTLDTLRLELQKIDRDIAAKEREDTRLKGVIAAYHQRVEAAPTREAELVELMRDYNTLEAAYNKLSSQREESSLAAKLEKREIGEQFSILEQARIPEKPISPNRPRMIVLGVLAGLVLGGFIVALLEYRDKSFATDEDVMRVLALPVLAVVPLMESTVEKQRSLRMRLFMGVGFGSAVLTCVAVVVYSAVY